MIRCPQCPSQKNWLGDKIQKCSIYQDIKKNTPIFRKRFLDEQGGGWHVHEEHVFEQRYMCSKGHKWKIGKKVPCWCGWPKLK